MVVVYDDGSTKGYDFKITKLPKKGRIGDDKYMVRFVQYPNVIGAGRTKIAALIEAKGNLKAYTEYLKETGQTMECLVRLRRQDGSVVSRQWYDMTTTTVQDIEALRMRSMKHDLMMDIVEFRR